MDLNHAYQSMVEAGEDWADKHAAASLLEETAKSVLADVITRLTEEGQSPTAAERVARGEPEYREHVMNMVEARRASNRARVNYDARRTYLELWRTQQATTRAEAQLAGVQR